MDLVTTFENINWLSVIVAAISSFFIGGIWYGPIFGKSWMTEFGFTEEDLKKRSIPKTFGLSLLLSFIAALVLEFFIGADTDLIFGAMARFFAGFGWVLTPGSVSDLYFDDLNVRGIVLNISGPIHARKHYKKRITGREEST